MCDLDHSSNTQPERPFHFHTIMPSKNSSRSYNQLMCFINHTWFLIKHERVSPGHFWAPDALDSFLFVSQCGVKLGECPWAQRGAPSVRLHWTNTFFTHTRQQECPRALLSWLRAFSPSSLCTHVAVYRYATYSKSLRRNSSAPVLLLGGTCSSRRRRLFALQHVQRVKAAARGESLRTVRCILHTDNTLL